MIIEMTECVDSFLGGRLSPKADQRVNSSQWARKEGGRGGDLAGFPSQRDLSGPQPFGHGSHKAIAGYVPHKIPTLNGKNEQENIVTINGVELVEMICPREDADARDRWCGQVSKSIVEGKKYAEIERMERAGVKTSEKEMEETILKA